MICDHMELSVSTFLLIKPQTETYNFSGQSAVFYTALLCAHKRDVQVDAHGKLRPLCFDGCKSFHNVVRRIRTTNESVEATQIQSFLVIHHSTPSA